jgi:hypothetical protein
MNRVFRNSGKVPRRRNPLLRHEFQRQIRFPPPNSPDNTHQNSSPNYDLSSPGQNPGQKDRTTALSRTHRFSDETTNPTNLTNQSDIRNATVQTRNKNSMSNKHLQSASSSHIRVIRKIRGSYDQRETTNPTNLTNQSDIRNATVQTRNKNSMSNKHLQRASSSHIRVIRKIRGSYDQRELALS